MNRHHPLAECEDCPLYKENSYVPSEASSNPRIAIVGEAPGQTEVAYKRPFMGESGELLEHVLESYGYDREETFLTNACSCRPSNNKTPTKKAIEACKPRLISELKEHNAETIMLLGSTATKSLFGHSSNITKARVGPPKEHLYFPDSKIIPTFHPAYALRNVGAFPYILDDFDKIDNSPPEWKEPEYEIIREFPKAMRVMDSLYLKPVAVDIETDYDKDNPSFQHPVEQNIICIGFASSPDYVYILGKELFDKPPPEGFSKSLTNFLNKNDIIMHNGKFDMTVLKKHSDVNLHFDTMLAMYCLNEARGRGGYSLSNMSIDLLNSPEWKSMKSISGNMLDLDEDVLYEYNALDVANTFRLYELLNEQLHEENLHHLHEFLIRSTYTLMYIEMLGIGINQEYQKEIYRETDLEVDNLLQGLRTITGKIDYNPRSWQQTTKALIDYFNVPFRKVPDTREATIKEIKEYAEYVANKDLWTYCDRLLRYKKAYKLKSVYIEGINKRLHKGRIHTSYFLHGTKTGRLSSGNPNLQNIPRNKVIKKQFIPPNPDYLFAQADYKQAEFRAVAYLSQDPILQEILKDPARDIHGEVAQEIFGKNYTPEHRFIAKQIVFGVTYGMTPFRLSMEIKIDLEDAKHYINKWWEMFPHTKRWVNKVRKTIDKKQYLQTPFGHMSRFHLITRENKMKLFKEGTAFLPQSLASNFCLEAANRLSRLDYGDKIIGLVHDAILFQTPSVEEAQLVKQVMEDTGEEYLEGFVPTPVDIQIGPTWGDLEEQGVLL